MWVHSFFRSLMPRPAHPAARRPRKRIANPLAVERLEDLCLPSFLSPVSYPVGAPSRAMVTGYFTGDGRPDLAFANPSVGAGIRVLPGNGDGTFRPAVISNGGPVSLAAGDFNADGKLDLVTADNTNVLVLLGNGDGTFRPPAAVSLGNGKGPVSVAVGDFNADGKLDLGVGSSIYYPGYSVYPGWFAEEATILLGNGTGSFAVAGGAASVFNGGAVAAVADVNNDGKQDLAFGGNSAYVMVYLGTGTGTLGSSYWSFVPGLVDTPSEIPPTLALGDVNGDGKLDAVVGNDYSNAVTVLLGNGQGSFTYDPGRVYATDRTVFTVALADFNGDAKLDVVAGDLTGGVNVLLGTGTGTFRPPVVVPTGRGSLYGVAVGDFNGDGRRDLATAGNSPDTAVLLNDGVWLPLDAPSIAVNDVTVTEGNAGTTAATFTVSLSEPPAQAVTVRYATEDGTATAGSDYQAVSGTLTFAPGETTKTVPVPVVGDRTAEGTESFRLVLTDPTNAFLADSTGAGSIVDDEPHVAIDYGPIYVTKGHSGTTTAVFTVRLSTAYDVPVGVNYSTAEGDTAGWIWGWYEPPPAATSGSDFVAASGTLTFAPNETVKTIAVVVNGDRLGETTEYFSLDLTGSTMAPIDAAHAVGVIVEDEPWISIGTATATEGNAGTTAMTFTVALSAAYDLPVTVNYATSDAGALAGSDYRAASGTVTLAPGQTTGTITILVIGDRVAEQTEHLTVTLSGATHGYLYPGYDAATGIIIDNEPRIRITSASITEGNSGTKLMTFTVTLSAAYDQTVTVRYATEDFTARAGEDYVATSGTLTFNPGQTSKTFTVTIKGDTKKEEDEYFYVRLSNSSSNALVEEAFDLGTILDDDKRRR